MHVSGAIVSGMDSVVIVAAAVAALALAAGVVAIRLFRARRRRTASGFAVATAVLALAVVVVVAAPSTLVPRAIAIAPSPSLSTGSLAKWQPTVTDSGAGYAGVTKLQIPVFPEVLRSDAGVTSRLPAEGTIGSVVIPATTSHFIARPAVVYLPPAALVPQPRLLPVVVAFSGQSPGAGPQDLALKAHLAATMDTIAAQHGGVAPIVVVPDQLGPATGNPMCVDSEHFGNVATYVMTDVRRWILRHLPVETSRTDWTVAGFSEGGTCAVQFGAAHPGVFGSIVDVSGELAPTNGTLAHTIAVGFGGNRTAYLHATPYWLLAHHRYADEDAYFAVGGLDKHYGPVAPLMAAHAMAAGMTVGFHVVPHDGHWWITGTAGLAWGLGQLAARWGL